MNFSKSKYVQYVNCPKAAWLSKYMPTACETNEADEFRFEEGHIVGDLAKSYFGDFVEATVCDDQNELDKAKMIERTKQFIQEGRETICEAAFSFEGAYCAVDLLHREEGGFAIYEVKSSTKVKPYQITDVSYQKYVLEHCGVKVVGAYVMHLDSSYVRRGEIRLDELFRVEDVWEQACAEEDFVAERLAQAEADLMKEEEPQEALGKRCEKCGYLSYCTRALPKPNVFDLVGSLNPKIKLYEKNVITLEQVADEAEKEFRKKHPHSEKRKDRSLYVEKEEIRAFLRTLSYPIYFLDFETMQPALPPFDGSRPYQEIPFQFSLHWIEKEGAEVKHTEYLAEAGEDPRRAIAERLVRSIPPNGCVLAYNKEFECGRIKEAETLFPDLAAHLRAIRENIKDLATPFQKKNCYARTMYGKYTIKYVLPALFPNDPALDYHNLDGVHNGTEAMEIFPKLASMEPEEAERTRRALWEYCKLDTLAMVRIWEELTRLAKPD